LTSYLKGTVVRVSGSFTNRNTGAAADPGTVRFLWRSGAGTTTYTYGVDSQLVKDSTGNYHVDIDTTSLTTSVVFRWEGTGSNQAAVEDSFQVTAGAF
jgi:hypothetical protein